MPWLVKRLVFVALTTCWCFSSFGAESNRQQFVSIVQLYPWGYTDYETGKVKGIHIELLDALSKITGIDYEPLIKPYARVEKDVITGTTPFTFLAADDKRLRQYAFYGTTLFTLPFGIVHSRGENISVPADFLNLDIGIPRGLSISACFQSGVRSRTKVTGCDNGLAAYYHVPVLDYTNGLKLLSGNKVDGLLGSLPTIQTILATQTDNKSIAELATRASYVVIKEVPIKVVYSDRDKFANTTKDLEEAFQMLIDNGVVESIYRSYIPMSLSIAKID